ncbi:MAG TPA: PDZ domain-containing protein [Vicinamibacterales bacterium]|nr:PDZ domain-containing protein [Vicinamibacterales bacterium]
MKIVLALLFLHVAAPSVSTAQTASSARPPEPIRYTIRFPAPHTHYMDVTAAVPTGGKPDIELMMAVWTPGSYLVREYQRNVERVTATGAGRSLAVAKSDKNRWRIATGGAATVTVTYGVYAHELSVRTNWVEERYALINGAPTFMTLADGVVRPHEVTLDLPAAWRGSMTGLRALAGAHRYIAPDFDTLVDSPIVAGNPQVYEFSVDGKPHYLVNEGDTSGFDAARAVKDLEAIVREHRRFWGALPYDKYVVLNVIVPNRGGGLEHKNSTVLLAGRTTTQSRTAYTTWLTTLTHEIFHTWNGKRLRPVELGPFDYEKEALTRSLWVVEGITDYYGDLLALRAGVLTRAEFLSNLSSVIADLQSTPGRLLQSVELASYDAWIRYYRPDENSPNVSISYYVKGQVLGFLLDARIRQLTNGARSLDDVMRAAYARYSGARGFTPEQFRQVGEQVAGTSLADFWSAWISGTGELDYGHALQTFGLRFRAAAGSGRASLGVTTRNDNGRLVVTGTGRERAGAADGLAPDDEILAINERRVRADQLARRLDDYEPGDRITVLIARRDQLERVPVTLVGEPPHKWEIEIDPAASSTQRSRLDAWLQPPRS